MKHTSQTKRLCLDIFSFTLEKLLDPSNCWYKLVNTIPWDKIERMYNKHCGGGVIGALIIKYKMNLPDEGTIQFISENPYMQYFVGLEEFTGKLVFDSSLFVYIRKRVDVNSFNAMILALVEEEYKRDGQGKVSRDKDNDSESGDNVVAPGKGFFDEGENHHKGSLKMDASCCNVDTLMMSGI